MKQLSAGEAIHLDPYGVMTPLDMPTGNFIGSADLAYRRLENANRRRMRGWKKKQRIGFCYKYFVVLRI